MGSFFSFDEVRNLKILGEVTLLIVLGIFLRKSLIRKRFRDFLFLGTDYGSNLFQLNITAIIFSSTGEHSLQ